jgi:hypothetical protein
MMGQCLTKPIESCALVSPMSSFYVPKKDEPNTDINIINNALDLQEEVELQPLETTRQRESRNDSNNNKSNSNNNLTYGLLHPGTIGDGPDTEQTRQMNLVLQDVIEGIYDATMKAQSNVQLNNLQHLFWMFPKDENGNHVARTVPLQVGEGDIRDVPIFTLLNHKNLCIHELKLKTSIDLQYDGKIEVNEPKSLSNTLYKLGVKSNVNKDRDRETVIEICMKIEDAPEIYSRILQNFENKL